MTTADRPCADTPVFGPVLARWGCACGVLSFQIIAARAQVTADSTLSHRQSGAVARHAQ